MLRFSAPWLLSLSLIFCAGNLSADTKTLNLMKQLSGTDDLPVALASAVPAGVVVTARKFGALTGSPTLGGAQIEMVLENPSNPTHSMTTTSQLLAPKNVSVAAFIDQVIAGMSIEAASCGTANAYMNVADDGTTVSIVGQAHGQALIVQATESYHTPKNQRYGEQALRALSLATCRMFADQHADAAQSENTAAGSSSGSSDDPWDFSGITLILEEPDSLVEVSLDDGKAYQLSLPPGQHLNVFASPNGNVIGRFNGSERELRAKYYYTANVNFIWAGMCSDQGVCGWVAADYLLSLPAGVSEYFVYRVMDQQIGVFERPDLQSRQLGNLFQDNLVAVIDQIQGSQGDWSRVCRLQRCDWVESRHLNFEY